MTMPRLIVLLLVFKQLTEYITVALAYPTYSPSLMPCDFYLFPQVQALKKDASEAEVVKKLRCIRS
jgi:hypothetical protein